MPVNINTFKILADVIMNKVQSGNSVTPAQVGIIADAAQMQAFEEDRIKFLKTGDSTDYLDWFLKTTVLNPNTLTGYAPYPSDFQHTAGVRAYYNGVERPVDLVENKAWGEVQASELMQPTRLFPKYTEFAGEYRFLPKNVGIVMLDYWKRPVVPVWGYTIVNNVPVYDASASTNFEWEVFAMNRVLAIYLQMCGCNLKDGQLEAFATQFKQENQSLL